MPNKLSRDQDIIRFDYIGDQTYEMVSSTTPLTKQMCEQVKSEGKPVLLLIDVSQIGEQNSGARKAALEALQTLPFDKMAVVGASPFIKTIGQFIFIAAGKTDQIQFFADADQAKNWLTYG